MFCTQCGNAIEPQARFCSRCGQNCEPAQIAQSQAQAKRRDWEMHINIVGWIMIGSSVLTGLLGFLIIFGGQIVNRMPFWIPDLPPDAPADVFRFAGSLAVFLGFLTLVLAAGIAAAGIGLLQYKEWGRVLTIIMSVFLIFHFPIGTAIAIYALWVLLSEEGRMFYRTKAVQTAG